MTYFEKISDYRTYSGQEFDFHYDYNANSGGGQAFLGGTFADNDGKASSPQSLEGLTAVFVVRYRDAKGQEQRIALSGDDRYKYPITPRGKDSSNMKLGLERKIRPSLLLPAALMLPETCAIDMAGSLEVSPLTIKNYWLRSMWLDCEQGNNGEVYFIPQDFIMSGGRSKQNGYATDDGKPTGDASFFKLNYERRIGDILFAADAGALLPDEIQSALSYFKSVLTGDVAFSHSACYAKTAELMEAVSAEYPTVYSGYDDPLPTIMEAIGHLIGGSPQAAPSKVDEPRNLIFFGAPGTGKSYQLARLSEKNFPKENVCRVTFHPDYTFAQFVGCYKPVRVVKPARDGGPASKAAHDITYDFVPGPFLQTYVEAVKNTDKNYLLIIEEINRANPTAVFGDIFQLLDRNGDGASEYEVSVPAEMRAFLKKSFLEYATAASIPDPIKLLTEQKRLSAESNRLSLPSNLFIWATMNSADQGVFPMDTAFKRRWDFRYMDINAGEAELDEIWVPVGESNRLVKWNDLRHAINEVLIGAGINEDKLLGPFFIAPSKLKDRERFAQVFNDKVLLYLFEDVAKLKPGKVFSPQSNLGATYSDICKDFNDRGELVFCNVGPLESRFIEEPEPNSDDAEA